MQSQRSKSSYRAHRYSGPKRGRKASRAQIKRFHGVTNTTHEDLWRKKTKPNEPIENEPLPSTRVATRAHMRRSGRSPRSVMPSSEVNVGFHPSAARRALLMGLAVSGGPPCELEMPLPFPTMTVKEEKVPPQNTPGGHVCRRRPLSPPPPLASAVVEQVEAMDDLTDCDTDEADEGHVKKVTLCTGQETPSSTSLALSTVHGDVRPSCSGMTSKTSKLVTKIELNAGSDLDSDYDDEFVVTPIETSADAGVGREIPDNEDLDEVARDIITSVEAAMDEAADNLPGVSNSFTWEEGFETFRSFPEEFSGPTPGPIQDYDTPYDAFTDIWSKDIMDLIARETNRYANQTIKFLKDNKTMKPSSRLHKWFDTNVDEIMLLFAVFMFMGIDVRTSQDEYWKSLGILTLSRFHDLMSFDRYVLLSKFLHFVDNCDVSQECPRNGESGLSARLSKLVPVISHLNKKFTSLYNLQREISIDESLTLFKGRLSWVQAIRTKAALFGIKSYELCESQTGYLAKFKIYTGKISDTDGDHVAPSVDLGGKTTEMVVELLQSLNNLGHCVTMDNFYSCPALARYLKSLGIDCLGTLRPSRKHTPRKIAEPPKYASKGTIIARHSGDVSVLAWKDTKWVTMISTYHDDKTYAGSQAGRTLVKPVSVRQYNDTMGGVDLKNQKLSMYLLERKRCVKWYVNMFKRLLNVSIHNAFVMYGSSLKRRGKLPVTHREFRYMLANSLYERHRRCHIEVIEPVSEEIRLRRDVLHVPQNVSGNHVEKLCVIHQRLEDNRKRVRSKCVTCDVFLCFENCWEEWHSLPVLKGREVRRRKRRRT